MKDQEEAQRLIDKYTEGLCTPEEKALVESGFLNDVKNSSFKVSEEKIEAAQKRMLAHIEGRIGNNTHTPGKHVFFQRIAIAASLILVLGLGLYFYQSENSNKNQQELAAIPVVHPGGNKAYLTLSDGRKILLSDSDEGKLAEQSGIVVSKTGDGQLVYEVSENDQMGAGSHMEYNTIQTPKGGQYQVILPDGTRVWLNSGSSIRFPVAFSPHSRSVETSGEIYFEVAKDKNRPFRVTSNHQVVEVLGTHFNINAYQDDGLIRTTLLEGSVRILSGDSEETLKPGEQSLVSGKSQIKTAKRVNIDEVIAWKNGDFMFRNSSLVSVTKQLERWYDVEFISSENLSYRFNGKISRDKSLTKVLKMMEITSGAKFKVEGRKIYMNK